MRLVQTNIRKKSHIEITLNEGRRLRSHMQGAWEKRGLFQLTVYSPSWRDVVSQEHGGKNWSRGHAGTLLPGLHPKVFLVCFPPHPGPPAQRWHRPHWPGLSHINHWSKPYLHRLAHRPIRWRQFFNQVFLLPDSYSLGQADKTTKQNENKLHIKIENLPSNESRTPFQSATLHISRHDTAPSSPEVPGVL